MRVFGWLALSLVACRLVLNFFALQLKTDGQRLMLEWPVLAGIILYGAAGTVLLRYSNFSRMGATPRGLAIAVVQGCAIAACTIAVDIVIPVAGFLGLAELHHPLPAAIPFYWYGAAVSEIWFHLLPVQLIFMAAARFGDRERAFWFALVVIAAWEGRRFFTAPQQHTPTGTILFMISYAANAGEIWLFRRYGFMTSVAQRMTAYALWHIAWPLIDPAETAVVTPRVS